MASGDARNISDLNQSELPDGGFSGEAAVANDQLTGWAALDDQERPGIFMSFLGRQLSDYTAISQDMREAEQEQTNLQRLLGHLQADTLAATLVSSQIDLLDQAPAEALKQVILDRLEEVRRDHEQPPDPVD